MISIHLNSNKSDKVLHMLNRLFLKHNNNLKDKMTSMNLQKGKFHLNMKYMLLD